MDRRSVYMRKQQPWLLARIQKCSSSEVEAVMSEMWGRKRAAMPRAVSVRTYIQLHHLPQPHLLSCGCLLLDEGPQPAGSDAAMMHSCATLRPSAPHLRMCSECAMLRCDADIVWSNRVGTGSSIAQHGEDEETVEPLLLQQDKTNRPNGGYFAPGLETGHW